MYNTKCCIRTSKGQNGLNKQGFYVEIKVEGGLGFEDLRI